MSVRGSIGIVFLAATTVAACSDEPPGGAPDAGGVVPGDGGAVVDASGVDAAGADSGPTPDGAVDPCGSGRCDAAIRPPPGPWIATHFVAPYASVPGAVSDQDDENGTPFSSATSPDTPCTFGEALTEAQPGDVVRLAPGVYVGATSGDRWTPAFAPANSGTADAPIVFFAEHPAAYGDSELTELRHAGEPGPILGPARGETDASDIVFDGFFIDVARNDIAPSAGLVQLHRATRCAYRRMRFDQTHDWGHSGDNYNMIFAQSNFDCVIADTVFEGDGTYQSHHNISSIQLYDSTNITIEHCEFRRGGTGIFAKGEYPSVPGSNSAVIRFNLFTGLSGHAIELSVSDSDVGNLAYQNLSYDTSNGGGTIHFENSGGGYKNNVFHHNTVEGGISIRAVDGEFGGGNAYYDNLFFDGSQLADTGGSAVEVLHDYGVSSFDNPYDYFAMADFNVFWRSDGGPMHASGHEGALFSSPMTLSQWQSALGTAGIPEAARQTGSIESDPMFVDAAGRDYRLADEGQPARTASSTGGPVGCYITGEETIGLRPLP